MIAGYLLLSVQRGSNWPLCAAHVTALRTYAVDSGWIYNLSGNRFFCFLFFLVQPRRQKQLFLQCLPRFLYIAAAPDIKEAEANTCYMRPERNAMVKGRPSSDS